MSNNNNEIDKLDEYVINATSITNRSWQKSLKKLLFKVLREAQQKRLMESNIIKATKKKCKIGNKIYRCPCCKNNFQYLHTAHIGKPIAKVIWNILDKYEDKLNSISFEDLLNEIIEKEKKYKLIIVCQNCNKNFETSD
jgi:hypothetical protein